MSLLLAAPWCQVAALVAAGFAFRRTDACEKADINVRDTILAAWLARHVCCVTTSDALLQAAHQIGTLILVPAVVLKSFAG